MARFLPEIRSSPRVRVGGLLLQVAVWCVGPCHGIDLPVLTAREHLPGITPQTEAVQLTGFLAASGRALWKLKRLGFEGVVEELAERRIVLPAEVVTSSCEDAFMTGYYKNLSARVHSFGFPIFNMDEEKEVLADSNLRQCWRNPDRCWTAVVRLDYFELQQMEELFYWAISGKGKLGPEPSGSATLLLLLPPACMVEDALLHIAPQVLELRSSGTQDYIIMRAALIEIQPGSFELPRQHRNLSRVIPPYPGGEPYSEAAYGFTQDCARGAVGPTDDYAGAQFHNIFGRVLCSPSIHSNPEDFQGEAAGLKIFVQTMPSLLNSDRLVIANLVRLAHNYSCDPGLFLCKEPHWNGAWSAWRQHMGEVVLLQKFLTAPPEVFVESADDADIILIPTLSQLVSSWYIFRQVPQSCPRHMLHWLKHLESKRAAHVFLFADHLISLRQNDMGGLNCMPALRPDNIFISHGTERMSPAHIAMPSIVAEPELQPSVILPADENRDVFLFYGETTDCCHPVRQHFYDVLTSDQGVSLCGPTCIVEKRWREPPHRGVEMSKKTHGSSSGGAIDLIQVMQQTIFCPMGPGDVPHRHKFYQAFLAGCIPVLFDFPSYFPGQRSWWKEYGSPFLLSVPFPEDIPYNDIVVIIPCTENYTQSAINMLLKLRAMPVQDISRRQRLLRDYRHFLGYQWDGSRPDAFTAIMQRIGRFVRRRPQLR
ncbi:GT13 [Symbiodinium natans]|uniref:GT13 protein n=1 Tax=Symbiodinium natans TaxID=878477 RepID=A0A812TFW5_9DINO|nr:GT13 [Symbiodinium natans]